jgi:hypothetical protein
MFADVADKPPTGALAFRAGQKTPVSSLRGRLQERPDA